MGEVGHAITRAAGVLTVAAGLLATGCTGGGSGSGSGGGTPGGAQAGALRLVGDRSCPELLEDLRRATERSVGPYGLAPGGMYGGDVASPPFARGGPDAAGPGARAPGAEGMAQQAPQAPSGAGAGQGQRAQQGQGHSGTNVHEAGVDEPDMVKTDGRRIVTVVDGRLRVVDVASRKVTGTLDLAPELPPGSLPAGQVNLLLHGDRALVLYQQLTPVPPIPEAGGGAAPGGAVPDGGAVPGGGSPGGQGGKATPVPPPDDLPPPTYGARMALVDLTAAPKVVGRLKVEGAHVDARQVGGVARVVVRSTPRFRFPPPVPGKPSESAAEDNRKRVREAPAQSWLPRFEVERDGRRQAGSVPCERLSHPRTFTGTSMMSLLTVNLAAPMGDGDPVTVMADGDTVYGTATSLYVTSNPRLWMLRVPQVRPGGPKRPGGAAESPPRPPETATEVHRFDIARPGTPRYAASGSVPGRLLNQYALSEYQGRLRVATTTDAAAAPPEGDPASQSAVHVLAQRGGRLVTEGRVGGLGKNERIYAVRFLGPVGYVVTFRETDPLYVVDLRNPAAPRVTGELKVTGYSAYLHPAGEGRLIGVGQEATEEGRRLGTQVALYDVRDPARPRRLAAHHVKSGSSEAEFDPHAFLHWPQNGLTVLPLTTAAAGPVDVAPDSPVKAPESAALVLKVDGDAVKRLGEVRHPEPDRPAESPVPSGDAQIRRSLVIGSTLWTVSTSGLRATAIDGLSEQAWVALG